MLLRNCACPISTCPLPICIIIIIIIIINHHHHRVVARRDVTATSSHNPPTPSVYALCCPLLYGIHPMNSYCIHSHTHGAQHSTYCPTTAHNTLLLHLSQAAHLPHATRHATTIILYFHSSRNFFIFSQDVLYRYTVYCTGSVFCTGILYTVPCITQSTQERKLSAEVMHPNG